jgi:hypothetical protein
MNKNKYLLLAAAAGLVASAAVAVPVFAATQTSVGLGVSASAHMSGMRSGSNRGMGMMGHGIAGTVTAINGDTITVSSKMWMGREATTTPAMAMTYTVDATNATVVKDGASSTVSSIGVNDMIMVQGTVTGTNVVATEIRDGMGGMMGAGGMHGMGGASSTSRTSAIQGNGEPVVAGSITAISGDTITVSNASDVTYTVDATSAKILENGTTTAMTSLATGDSVVIQGTVNGTSITASSIIDQGSHTSTGGSTNTSGAQHGAGFLGAIGSFFKRIFGF